MMTKGFLYTSDNTMNKLAFEEKVKVFIQKFEDKFGFMPDSCLVSDTQGISEILGVMIETNEKLIRQKNFFFMISDKAFGSKT